LYGTLFVDKGAGPRRCFLSRLTPVKSFKTAALKVFEEKLTEMENLLG